MLKVRCLSLSLLMICGCLLSSCSKGENTTDSAESESEILRQEYENAVSDYNTQAEQINEFLEQITRLHPSVLPEQIPLKETSASGHDLQGQIEAVTDETQQLQILYQDTCSDIYHEKVRNYNILADAYNECTDRSYVGNILNMKPKTIRINQQNELLSDEKSLLTELKRIDDETGRLASDYKIVNQLIQPTAQWVMSRLNNAELIGQMQPVTAEHDPNGMLGAEDGYTSCVYFTAESLDENYSGIEIADHGTDAGGAVEVYPTLEAAKKRCGELAQYDNTLLYSGSYTLIGTMVVRTSYRLTNQEQIDLTDQIITAFTALDE